MYPQDQANCISQFQQHPVDERCWNCLTHNQLTPHPYPFQGYTWPYLRLKSDMRFSSAFSQKPFQAFTLLRDYHLQFSLTSHFFPKKRDLMRKLFAQIPRVTCVKNFKPLYKLLLTQNQIPTDSQSAAAYLILRFFV